MKNLKILLCCCMALIVVQTKAQNKFSLGAGAGITAHADLHGGSPLPRWPASVYITAKIKRHEILAGPDIYFPGDLGETVYGGQLAYRYHFLREGKLLNPFIDCNFQAMKYKSVNGRMKHFDSENEFGVSEYLIMTKKCFVNTYGLGLQMLIKQRISVYSIIGAGYSYVQNDVLFVSQTRNYLPDTEFRFTAYAKLGLSVFIFNSKS